MSRDPAEQKAPLQHKVLRQRLCSTIHVNCVGLVQKCARRVCNVREREPTMHSHSCLIQERPILLGDVVNNIPRHATPLAVCIYCLSPQPSRDVPGAVSSSQICIGERDATSCGTGLRLLCSQQYLVARLTVLQTSIILVLQMEKLSHKDSGFVPQPCV